MWCVLVTYASPFVCIVARFWQCEQSQWRIWQHKLTFASFGKWRMCCLNHQFFSCASWEALHKHGRMKIRMNKVIFAGLSQLLVRLERNWLFNKSDADVTRIRISPVIPLKCPKSNDRKPTNKNQKHVFVVLANFSTHRFFFFDFFWFWLI